MQKTQYEVVKSHGDLIVVCESLSPLEKKQDGSWGWSSLKDLFIEKKDFLHCILSGYEF